MSGEKKSCRGVRIQGTVSVTTGEKHSRHACCKRVGKRERRVKWELMSANWGPKSILKEVGLPG